MRKAAPELSNGEIVRRLLALCWHYRAQCFQVLFYQLVVLVCGIAGLGLTGLGIDEIRYRVTKNIAAPRWPFGWEVPGEWDAMSVVGGIAVGVFLFACMRGIFSYLYTAVVNELVQGDIVVNLRAQVYEKLQRLSFRFFDANASGSIINRVTADVQSLRMFVDQVIIQAIVLFLSLTVYLVYMLNIHVMLTVACLASTPLLWWFSVRFSNIVRPFYLESKRLMDSMTQRLAETIKGIQVVKTFGRENEAFERYLAANQAVKVQQNGIFFQLSLFSPVIGFLSQINIIVLLAYGGYLALRGEIPVGTGLVVFAAMLQQFSNQVANISTITDSLQQSLTGARRVFEVLDTPLEIYSQNDPVVLAKVEGRVRFENVRFEHDAETVLHNVDFEVAPGTSVAIIGPTGAGKSVLLSLIPRFYDPAQGKVRLDGTDLRQLDVSELRKSIGVVFQESFLFASSIAQNIAFGNPQATMEQIIHAAKLSSAHEFIQSLPNGYDTVLNEGGGGLSGGQRQRLALARALILEPPILLLDDPTASLDPSTEEEIVSAVRIAMEGRTTFIIAHRPSMVKEADRVVVLDRGRIVQQGTHSELILQGGYYREVMGTL